MASESVGATDQGVKLAPGLGLAVATESQGKSEVNPESNASLRPAWRFPLEKLDSD